MAMAKYLIILLFPLGLLGQSANGSFSSALLSANAAVRSLGGLNLTQERSINYIATNPALLDSAMANQALFNLNLYYGGITHTDLTYILQFPKSGLWALGLKILNYGNFAGRTALNAATQDFKARDFVLRVGKNYELKPFSIGANLKLAGSTIGQYSAFALLFDLATTFIHPDKDFRFSLAFKNIGVRLKTLTPADQSQLPLDLQVGLSYRYAEMPFRFSFTLHNLLKPSLVFNDPLQNALLNKEPEQVSLANRLTYHMILGTELLLTPHLVLRFGYNILAMRTLGDGLNFGLGLRIRRIDFNYAIQISPLATRSNHTFSLAFKVKDLVKKKKIVID